MAQGETWSVGAQGERYQRWWGEDHFGNGWVRKHGNSNTGKHLICAALSFLHLRSIEQTSVL